MKTEFWIQGVSGIPDSLSYIPDSDSTSKISRIPDSTSLRVAAPSLFSPFFLCREEGAATSRLGFHKLKFLGFRNLDSLTRGDYSKTSTLGKNK